MSTTSVQIESRKAMARKRPDIAHGNLVMAEGLPGFEGLEVDALLQKLDRWTELVRRKIRKLKPRFQNNRQQFNNSWAYFQVLVMATVLGKDLKVRYRMEVMEDPVDWSDSRSQFIHGLLSGYGGTCCSMPVLFVAMGRRLGWPLWLVPSKCHLFARWEDLEGRDRFNIEVTGQGLNCHSDEHYRHWPKEVTQEEIDKGWYLHNLSPDEEVANNYHQRSICLMDNFLFEEGLMMADAACNLYEKNPNYRGFHAIFSVIYCSQHGIARYHFRQDTDELVSVEDKNGVREPEAWEKWAALPARNYHQRIIDNHRARSANAAHEEVFASLDTDQHPLPR